MLKNAAVSTSGDAYQFIEIGGRRFSHIVDPKTGLGLTRRTSVTVISVEGIAADSLATAACVLGPERGLQLIERTPNAAAIFVELTEAADPSNDRRPEKDRLRTFESRNFAAYEIREPKPREKSH